MLRIGDSDGMKFVALLAAFDVQSSLGVTGRLAEAGAELDSPPVGKPSPPAISSHGEAFGPSEEAGVHSPCEVPRAWPVVAISIGRNKSRVKSKISEPIAPMAVEYLSRRILDSLTMKSANRRTRSASMEAAASLSAKSRKRSIAAAAN